MDSLELMIDQDYVIVSGPPLDLSSSGGRASKLGYFPSKTGESSRASGKTNRTSNPVSVRGGATGSVDNTGNSGSNVSTPRTSQGSMDIEQPSGDCMVRIKSLQCCASSITELVNEKVTCSTFLLQILLMEKILMSHNFICSNFLG